MNAPIQMGEARGDAAPVNTALAPGDMVLSDSSGGITGTDGDELRDLFNESLQDSGAG